jgi:hypothetical protein
MQHDDRQPRESTEVGAAPASCLTDRRLNRFSDIGASRVFEQKSRVAAWVACKHVANIQDMTWHYRKAQEGMKVTPDLDWMASDGTR